MIAKDETSLPSEHRAQEPRRGAAEESCGTCSTPLARGRAAQAPPGPISRRASGDSGELRARRRKSLTNDLPPPCSLAIKPRWIESCAKSLKSFLLQTLRRNSLS